MSRKKTISAEAIPDFIEEPVSQETVQIQQEVVQESPTNTVIMDPLFYRKTIRNKDGLLENLTYVFDEYGFIDWRAMVNPKHVVLNKYAYAKEGVDVLALNQEEQEKLLANATEDKKLIKLLGFRELARIRGIKKVDYEVVSRDLGTVAIKCTIKWMPNYETDYLEVKYSTIANASVENVDANFVPFLEAIACNRSFVRVVREYLNIPILGQDEIKNDEIVNINKSPTPHKMLSEWMANNNYSFESILAGLAKNGVELKEDWINIDLLPTPVVITALELISRKAK